MSPNSHIRVYDLKSGDPFAYYVARSAEDGRDDTDRSMIATAIERGETVASGGMVLEYFTEPSIILIDEDYWNRKIYRYVDRDNMKKRPRRYADVNGYLHVMTDDGEPSHPIARTLDHWIYVDGVLSPPQFLTTDEFTNDLGA
jgi:hypothetical protein